MASHASHHLNLGGRRMLSLLLCVLLAAAPLAGAAPWPTAESDLVDPISQQMPCHVAIDASAQAGVAPAQADCPHCAGEAAPTSCQCCGQAGQAGIDSRLGAPTAVLFDVALRGAAPMDPLPDSPMGRLFRPPIAPR